MSNLNTMQEQLDTAWRALTQRWEQTKAVWNDPVRWEFEKNNWTPLQDRVQDMQHELEQLAQLIVKSKQQVN